MAKSILDIVIKLSKQGGADKETITGLVKVKSALMESAAVAGTFVAAGYTIKKVLDETVSKYVAYAAEVRRASEATGMNTEETSRLIQVLDDVKIEYGDLEKVIRTNADAFDYTTAGLAKMSSEYLALGSETERAAYMQERFGKQWVDFVPLMKLGGDAIQSMSASVDENRIITEKAEAETRRYEIAVDNVSDAWQSFTFGVAPPLMNALTAIINKELDIIRAREILMAQGFGKWDILPKGAWEEAVKLARAEREAAEAVLLMGGNSKLAAYSVSELASSQEAVVSSTEDLTAAQNGWKSEADTLVGTMTSLQTASETYDDTLADINQRLKAHKINQKQANEEIQAAVDVYDQASAQIILDLIEMQLASDGWQESDTAALLSAGKSLGIYEDKFIGMAESEIASAIAMSKAHDMLAAGAVENLPIVVDAMKILDEQLFNGSLTAAQYTLDVDAIYEAVKNLDGSKAKAVIDIIVNGGVPVGFDTPDNAPLHNGVVEARAGGGPLADVTMVGEDGYEMVVKGSNGQYTVIPHEAAAWMIRAGLMPSQYAANGKEGPYVPPPPPAPRSHRAKLPNTASAAMSPQDAASTAQAAQATAQATAAATVAAQQQSVANSQATAASLLSNEESINELRKLNRQMRDLKADMANAMAAAMQRSI